MSPVSLARTFAAFAFKASLTAKVAKEKHAEDAEWKIGSH
jgi:hypothetical protein